MNRLLILAILLVPLMLSLGCVSPEKNTAPKNNEKPVEIEHNDKCEGDACTVTQDTNEDNEMKEQPEEVQENTEDIGLKGLDPMGSYICEYDTESPDGSIHVKIMYKGGSYRFESIAKSPQTDTPVESIMIYDGEKDKMYVKLNNKDLPQTDCEWMDMTFGGEMGMDYSGDEENDEMPSGSINIEDISSEYNCHPADVPDEMIHPSGKVCSLQDMAFGNQ